ncbi:MAG: HAMP domain-containing protein [Alphaproteobacteria bacterium]|nr:HAMP domain-containing protein [Alphaproteobacteria bacterium]
MYFSLKKKMFYTVFSLFVFMATLFLTMFMVIYSEKYSRDYDALSMRNQYVMSLLYDNITLQREVNRLRGRNKETSDLSDKQKELTKEAKINNDLQKNFNEQAQAFVDGMKIIGISLVLSLCSILGLGFVLQRWVILPINKLSKATKLVSEGDFSHRIQLDKKQVFFDEFDTLADTFNSMISSVENSIAEIKNSELFLQLLIDTIPDGIRVIDRNYNIVLSNKAYDKQFSALGHTEKCFQAYGYDKPCPRGIFSCPLKEIKNVKNKSIAMIQNVDGHPLSVNAAPLKVLSQNKEDFFIIESIRDLSDDIRFSHQQKISSLGFLATSVAHEMKNNLGSIRMIMEALMEQNAKGGINKEDTTKYIKLIHDQILASIAIPERLLKLARNNVELQEVFDIRPAISEVVSLLDYEAKRNGITIVENYASTENNIAGNTADFKMIILNLAQNAVKAMPSGGELKITTSKDRNNVSIEMQDTGIGIDSEKVKHIFEPFYSEGQTNRLHGTGLGLAIVKALVDKYRGDIYVSSVVGKGTTFEIKFPRAKA